MSYWAHHPELYDEITTNALPEPYKSKVIEGEIDLYDLPEDILYKAALEGEREYWAGLVDEARMRKKEEFFENPSEDRPDPHPWTKKFFR